MVKPKKCRNCREPFTPIRSTLEKFCQKDGLKQIVCDLDQVKETLKELKAENEELMRKLWKLHSDNLELNELKKILE